MEISEQDKALVLRAQKIFPEVWVYLQREANRNTPWADLILSLEALLDCGAELRVPWAFLEWKLKEIARKRDQKRIDQNVEEWEDFKIQDREDVRKWLLGVKPE